MDDVEGIIKLVHEILADIFDVKQFLDVKPKILNELSKKQIDPELESYYWTGGKEWDSLIERLDRVTLSKRGDPGIFVANQASLPHKGQLTAMAQFHRAPVELP